MMRSSKSSALTFAKKCKNILASNWQGNFNTIKADVKESKNEIFTSKVKYFVKKGRPYIWVPEDELHNVNVIMDERSSFAVTSPIPGRLPMLLRSIKKLPSRVALVGDVVPLKEGKVSLASESLTEMISSERKAVNEASYSVSAILNSSNLVSTSRSENLQELLHGDKEYIIYRFNISSCTYIDGNGSSHEVDVEEIEASKADPLSRFSMSLIDGINQSEARRRALVLLCGTLLSKKAKDAYMLSVDTKGFDVLGKVQGPAMSDGSPQYQWKELRFLFKEDACDVETFCNRLVDMEEEAIKNSGLV